MNRIASYQATGDSDLVGAQLVGRTAPKSYKAAHQPKRKGALRRPLVEGLRLLGACLVLGELLPRCGRDLRRNDPRRVLGLRRAGVLLAKPCPKDLGADAQLLRQFGRGVSPCCHFVTSLRAFVVYNVHSTIVSHMAAANTAVAEVYKPFTKSYMAVGSKLAGHAAGDP